MSARVELSTTLSIKAGSGVELAAAGIVRACKSQPVFNSERLMLCTTGKLHWWPVHTLCLSVPCVRAQGYDGSHCGLISGSAMAYLAGIEFVAASIAGNSDLGLDSAVQLIQDKLQSQASNGSQPVQVPAPPF